MNICIQHSASFCGFLNCRRCCFSGLLSYAEARELLGHGVPELGVGHCVHDRVDAAGRLSCKCPHKIERYISYLLVCPLHANVDYRLFTREAGYLRHEGSEGGLVAEGGQRRHAGVRGPDGEPEQHVRDGHLGKRLSVMLLLDHLQHIII